MQHFEKNNNLKIEIEIDNNNQIKWILHQIMMTICHERASDVSHLTTFFFISIYFNVISSFHIFFSPISILYMMKQWNIKITIEL